MANRVVNFFYSGEEFCRPGFETALAEVFPDGVKKFIFAFYKGFAEFLELGNTFRSRSRSDRPAFSALVFKDTINLS